MKNVTASLISLVVVVLLLVVGACSLSGALTGYTVDVGSGQIYNPKANAEATRVAQLAIDEARAREITRQGQQAEADAATAALPAATLRNVLIYTGTGTGVLVLAVGVAFAVVAWLNKRATAIYPNAAGQYPVIVRRGFGWVVFHDPSRQLSSAAVYRTPTLLDVLAGIVAIVKGLPTSKPEVTAEFPPTGSEGAMLQATTQAQVGGVAAAQNRWPKTPLFVGRVTNSVRGDEPPAMIGPAASRMPQITVVSNPQEIAEFRERLLLEAEGH